MLFFFFSLVRPHVVTSNIEHVAIDLPLRQWESDGLIEVTFVEVDSKGRLNAKDALSAIKPNTCLLSVMAGTRFLCFSPFEKLTG